MKTGVRAHGRIVLTVCDVRTVFPSTVALCVGRRACAAGMRRKSQVGDTVTNDESTYGMLH